MKNDRTQQNLISTIKQSIQELKNYDAPFLHQFEARMTLMQLKKLILTPSQNLLENTTDFLNRRWLRIQDSNNQYLHDFTNPANQCCIEVAKEISAKKDVPYLTILMPGLKDIPTQNYVTSSYADPINLQNIILSDDKRSIIHIPDCLTFAREDACLKSLVLNNGKPQKLSENEKQRLLSRDDSIKATYEMIVSRHTFRFYGFTMGAAVLRLIEGLRSGGAFQKGSEFNAEASANHVIVDFYMFLESLSKEKKQKLLSAYYCDDFHQHYNAKLNIEELWNRLRNPKVNKIKGELSAIYCVELIADKLEKILEHNVWLYDETADYSKNTTTLFELNQKLDQHFEWMSSQLKQITKHACYSKEDHQQIRLLLMSLRASNFSEFNKNEIVFLTQLYSDWSLKNYDLGTLSINLLRKFSQKKTSRELAALKDEMPYQLRSTFEFATNNPSEEKQTEFNLFNKKRKRQEHTEDEPPLKRNKPC